MTDKTERLEAELEKERASLRHNVDELTERLSPGRLKDDAMHALKKAPKKLASGVGSRVMRDPIPALLIGVGLAWMLKGHSKSEQPSGESRLSGDGPNGYYGVQSFPSPEECDAHAAWENHQESVWAVVIAPDEAPADYQSRLMRARAESLGVTRRDDEDDTGFKARVEQTADKAKHFAASFRDKVKRAAGSGARKLSGARDAVESGAGSAKHAIGNAARRSEHYAEEHPLTTGAVGLALGAVIGSLLPLSRAERDQLQGFVDKGIDRGADGVTGAARAVSAFAQDVESSSREY